MKAALARNPRWRMVMHREPAMVIDVPHVLIYDPADASVRRAVAAFRRMNPRLRRCDVTGASPAAGFYVLAMDC